MSSALNFSLDQLVAEAGDDSFEMNTRNQPAFKNNVAYPIEITAQEVKESQNGWNVLYLTLGRVQADGSIGNGDKVIECLPTFSEAQKASQDPEKLTALKQSWGTRLHGILRALVPTVFSVYASSNKTGNRWKFFDEDGNEMSGAAKKAREEQIAKAVIAFSERMTKGNGSLVGTRAYYVRSENKKDPTKTYNNFYSDIPNSYPLAE